MQSGKNARIKMTGMRKIVCLVIACLLTACSVANLSGCQIMKATKNKTAVSILAKNSWYTTVDYSNCAIIQTLSQKSGYDLQWKFRQPSSYYEAVRPLLLSASEDLADIIQLPDLDSNMEYINAGIFVALDEYLDQMPNFKQYLSDHPDIAASLTTEDGHIYYVPQTVLTQNYQPCIMYNQSWLDQLGLAVPETLDEFVTMLKLFAANDMNGNGIIGDEVPMSVMENFLPYLFGTAFGLDLVNGFYADDNGTVHYAYSEADQYKQYLVFLNQLYEEGLLEPGYETLTRDEITNRCANDQTGVIFDYSWQMSSLYSAQYAEYDGVTPIFTAGVPLSGEYQGYYVGRSAISGFFGVTSTSSCIEDAVKVLDYIMGDSSQDLYCWGIQGTSYEVDEEGNYYYTDQATDDTWLQNLGINPSCVPSRQSLEATNALLPAWHRRFDQILQKYVKESLPFSFATEEEAEVIQGYENYIAAYVEQQMNYFITGQSGMDTYNEYLQTLEKMNIQDLIRVKQQEYDRYLIEKNSD